MSEKNWERVGLILCGMMIAMTIQCIIARGYIL